MSKNNRISSLFFFFIFKNEICFRVIFNIDAVRARGGHQAVNKVAVPTFA